jgi:hypothetical protein
MPGGDPPRQVMAIHSRHDNVGKHGVERLGGAQCHGFRSVGRCPNVVPGFFERGG